VRLRAFARAAARAAPVVVATTAAAAGRDGDRRAACRRLPGALRSTSDGMEVKIEGMGEPCEDEVTSLLIGRAENRKRWLEF
jgi:hypothetical protein